MQRLPSQQVRNIGVANFDIHNMNILLRHPSTHVVPAVNQIELHPYNTSTALVAHCKKQNIQCMGFSPLGSKGSSLAYEPDLMAIASRHRRTPQQVLLKWALQNGWGVIPGSFNKDHIVTNLDLDGWVLDEDELLRLSSMEKKQRVYDDVQRMRLPLRVFLDAELGPPGPTSSSGENSVRV